MARTKGTFGGPRPETRKNYGPNRDRLRLERRGKRVEGMGETETVTGRVTNRSESRDGAKYITLQVKAGTGRRYNKLMNAFSQSTQERMDRGEESGSTRSRTKRGGGSRKRGPGGRFI